MTMPNFDPDALLAPIAGSDAAGVSLRYDPLWSAIREARESDDATLPMGVWERPLVKADWKRVADLCTQALATRSKDFQLAAWLCEAWTHLHGIGGFSAGAWLMEALIARHWLDAWPRIDDGDTDARCAPFIWLNENLPMLLSLHVPLLVLGGERPLSVTLVTWDRSLSEPHPDDEDASARNYLAERAASATAHAMGGPRLDEMREAMGQWAALDAAIDERLGMEAPSLARVTDMLARMSRTVIALRGDEPEPLVAVAPDEAAAEMGEALQSLLLPALDDNGGPSAVPLPVAVSQAWAPEGQAVCTAPECAPVVALNGTPDLTVNGIVDRAHAYRLLAAVADYLAQHEPHSPTPYLVRRAVRWGQMPLPELMRAMLQDDGDISRYFSLLEDQ